MKTRREILKSAGRLAGALALGLALTGCGNKQDSSQENEPGTETGRVQEYRTVLNSHYPITSFGFGNADKNRILYNIRKAYGNYKSDEDAKIFFASPDEKTIHEAEQEKNKERVFADISQNVSEIDFMLPSPYGAVAYTRKPEGIDFFFFDEQGNLLNKGRRASLERLADGKSETAEAEYPLNIFDFGEYSGRKGYFAYQTRGGFFIPADGGKIIQLDRLPENAETRHKLRSDLNKKLGDIGINYPSQIRVIGKKDDEKIQAIYRKKPFLAEHLIILRALGREELGKMGLSYADFVKYFSDYNQRH